MNENFRRQVESAFAGFSSPLHTGRSSETLRQKPLITKEWLRGAPFITVVDESEEARLFDLRRQGLQTFSFEEKPDKIVVCPSDFEVSEIPITNGHDGSMSVYRVDMRRGRNRLLIAYLGPNAWTSEGHGHPPKLPANDLKDALELETAQTVELDETMSRYPLGMYEYYEKLFGSFKIHHVEGDEGYWAPEFFRVDPGILHQMEGGPDGAIISNVMLNANLYPDELQHIHF